MKNKFKLLLAVSLMAVTGLASAHSMSGGLVAKQLKKGSKKVFVAAPAVDIYQVDCGAGTTKLYYRVKTSAVAVASKISIQGFKGGASTLSTDPVNTDAKFSPAINFANGEGSYSVSVSRPASATWGFSENYVAEMHCQDKGGAHTETTITMTQNQ
ncbi:hypothetical protein [Crenothrix polyspora]|uniref:Uncharacterized protein n=1 Tax=Crenothrix polyspora TaxID=360316 RepID=A0A1R4HIA6_9GAMM|nr:hypothetical protein [Crenothrix polyspora]SJM95731.1 exported hypothetical protein [Crenothrix polyspora]